MRRLVFSSLVFVCSLAPLARADESRIPIFQPVTITQPGHYILTRDLNVPGGAILTVHSNNVTVDLNGRTLSGSGTASGDTLIQVGDGYTTFSIRNGRLQGGYIGINYSSSVSTTRMIVEGVEITGTASHGIFVGGADHVTVNSCRILGAGGDGMLIGGLAGSFTGDFVGNVVRGVGSAGIALIGLRGGHLQGNSVSSFGTTTSTVQGISLTGVTGWDQGGNLVEGNTVRVSDDDFGILIDSRTPDNIVLNNVVTATGNTGISVASSGNRIAMNVASANRGAGLSVAGDRNVIERNHAEGNAGQGLGIVGNYMLIDDNVIEGNGAYGIFFTSGVVGGVTVGAGHAYRNNMIRGNVSGAIFVGAGATPTDAGGNIL